MVELLLGSGNIGLGVLDLSVLTKVWNEVISFWLFRWIERSFQNVIKTLLGSLGVLEGRLDVRVGTEVWHEIISWWISSLLNSGKLSLQFRFSINEVLVVCQDLIIDTEVWHFVVHWPVWGVPG